MSSHAPNWHYRSLPKRHYGEDTEIEYYSHFYRHREYDADQDDNGDIEPYELEYERFRGGWQRHGVRPA